MTTPIPAWPPEVPARERSEPVPAEVLLELGREAKLPKREKKVFQAFVNLSEPDRRQFASLKQISVVTGYPPAVVATVKSILFRKIPELTTWRSAYPDFIEEGGERWLKAPLVAKKLGFGHMYIRMLAKENNWRFLRFGAHETRYFSEIDLDDWLESLKPNSTEVILEAKAKLEK